MADGSIRIGTKLDTTQLKKDIKDLERELARVRKEQAKAEETASKIKSQYEAEKDFDSQFPEEFSHRKEIEDKEAAALAKVAQQQEELNRQEQEYLTKLEAANAKLAERQSLASASKQVDDTVKSEAAVDKITSQAEYNSLLDATLAKMAAIEAAAERVSAETGLTKEQILAANPGYQKLSDTMGVLQARASDFGGEAATAGTTTQRAMGKAEKSVRRVNDEARRGMRLFGRTQLAMFGMMFAMRAISSATQEYMAVNTELEGQLNTLKAMWGQVLGPVIQWVINLLIQAISAVNAFVYALTGNVAGSLQIGC